MGFEFIDRQVLQELKEILPEEELETIDQLRKHFSSGDYLQAYAKNMLEHIGESIRYQLETLETLREMEDLAESAAYHLKHAYPFSLLEIFKPAPLLDNEETLDILLDPVTFLNNLGPAGSVARLTYQQQFNAGKEKALMSMRSELVEAILSGHLKRAESLLVLGLFRPSELKFSDNTSVLRADLSPEMRLLLGEYEALLQ